MVVQILQNNSFGLPIGDAIWRAKQRIFVTQAAHLLHSLNEAKTRCESHACVNLIAGPFVEVVCPSRNAIDSSTSLQQSCAG